MPVDLCTPLIFALSMLALPLYAGFRGTRAAFAAVCTLSLAVGIGVGASMSYLVLIWAVPNAIGFVILLTRLRRRAGPGFHCQRCGYDLRATPERCPECGNSPDAAAATAIAAANAAADALADVTSPRDVPADGSK